MSFDDQLKALEDAQWFQQKGALMDKHLEVADAIVTAAASAGWERAPGVAWERTQAVEVETKTAMAALNLGVAQESLERMLRHHGEQVEHEIAEALEQVETEKMMLLSALNEELLALKADTEHRMEALAQLLVHEELRELIIIQAKTRHEIEVQRLRRQMVEMEGRTFDAERRVIEKKLTLATAKLRIIPELQKTLAAQQRQLEEEQLLMPLYEQRMVSEAQLIEVLEETIPLLLDKSAEALSLAAEIRRLLPVHQQILDLRRLQEQARGDAEDEAQAQRLAELTYERRRDALQIKENSIQALQVEKATELSKIEARSAEELASLRAKISDVEVKNIEIVGHNKLATAEEIAKYKGKAIPPVERHTERLREEEIVESTSEQTYAKRRTAEIAAKAQITAKLIHAVS